MGSHLPLEAFLQAVRLPHSFVSAPAAPPQPHHYSRGFLGVKQWEERMQMAAEHHVKSTELGHNA